MNADTEECERLPTCDQCGHTFLPVERVGVTGADGVVESVCLTCYRR